ncbi:MAG: hypothetical protein JW723_11580 [Bacteroidales bacterium]|nr:hypothetical protein [Bacteroidales bacterium]
MRRIVTGLLLSALTFVISIPVSGQDNGKRSLRDKIYFGGDFSLMFGTVTFIEVSPIAGYRFTPRFSSGLGITYQYYREKLFSNTVIKSHIYGGRVFSKYILLKDLNEFIPVGLHAGLLGYCEYEFLNLESYFSLQHESGRFWLHSFYVGGGLELPVGRRSSMNLLVLFNLNDTGESPYSNPVVRIGIVL